MCLIVFAWQMLPRTPLFAVANRDEFYARRTVAAAAWDDCPNVYGGRDLDGGGTWMGIAQGPGGQSRFAAITNFRAKQKQMADAPSRGALVADYLKSEKTAAEYIAAIAPNADRYNGFNLILGDQHTLIWYSNRAGSDPRNGQPLAPGIYGLSNALLDTPWPKLIKTKAQFSSLLCQGAPDAAYFEMLADTSRARDVRLPDTGVALELERMLSAVCIESPNYGTRSSTLVKLHAEAPSELKELILR